LALVEMALVVLVADVAHLLGQMVELEVLVVLLEVIVALLEVHHHKDMEEMEAHTEAAVAVAFVKMDMVV
jgi:hypothetical protein